MGGKWIDRDEMSGLILAFRLQPVYREVMDQKWGRFTKFHNETVKGAGERAIEDGKATALQNASEAPPSEAGKGKAARGSRVVPKATPKGAGGTQKAAGGTPKAAAGADTDQEQDPADAIAEAIEKRKSDSLKDLNKECQKLKTMLKSCQSDGNTLLNAFKNDQAYAWGRDNDEADGALTKGLELNLSKFEKEFMLCAFGQLQKRYGPDHIVQELEAFKAKKERISGLNDLVQSLLRMHSAEGN